MITSTVETPAPATHLNSLRRITKGVNEKVFPREWDGWYFAEGLLVSPNGDVFTPQQILACTFYRQLQEVKNMIYPPMHTLH